MELTPQLLETQQFPEKWRGYDQDAVDEFLERVGVGLAELQDRLRTAAARLKELEANGPVAHEAPAVVAAPEPAVAGSSVTQSDATAVGRALVLAQEAADRAIAEANAEAAVVTKRATAEAERITTTAQREADRLVQEAEVKHAAATSRLSDADAHVAELAAAALSEARADAAKLISDAEVTAAGLTATAQAEADRLTSSATEAAQRHADEVASRRSEELVDLDTQIAGRRREAAALQAEINDRQGELRSVVEGLQSLVGRVGSLAGTGATSPEPVAAPESVETASHDTADAPTSTAFEAGTAFETTASETVASETTASETTASETAAFETTSFDSATAHDTGLDDTDTRETAARETASPDTVFDTGTENSGVVIDLTADDAVKHSASGAVDDTSNEESTDDETAMPKWATVDSPLTPGGQGRRGLTVVSNTEGESSSPVAVVELDELAPRTSVAESADQVEEMTITRVSDETPSTVDSSQTAVIDDPFLAALRGPERVEFDDEGEPDAERSSFKRRRRRRL